VMVAAHAVGDKELRSKAIDYMLKHGSDVQKYAKMKAQATVDLKQATTLSESMVAEISRKAVQRVEDMKHERMAKIKIAPSKRKQRTCVLCKRVFAKDQLRIQPIPAIFGHGDKARTVCVGCTLVSSFVAEQPRPEEKK